VLPKVGVAAALSSWHGYEREVHYLVLPITFAFSDFSLIYTNTELRAIYSSSLRLGGPIGRVSRREGFVQVCLVRSSVHSTVLHIHTTTTTTTLQGPL